jgi:hypothetical protein
MKRKLSLIIFACLAFAVQGIYAQDAIMKNSGEEILAKVLEVGSEQVKYKKFDNLDGPSYSISSSEIFMIKYEDGSKKLFEKNPSTGKITVRHTAAETDKTPATSTAPKTSAAPATSAAPKPDESGYKLPVPSTGETLYEGTGVFSDKRIEGFKLAFLLSANGNELHSVGTGYEYKSAGYTSRVYITTGTNRYPVDTDINIGNGDILISDLKFDRNGASAKVRCVHKISQTDQTVNFGTSDVVFKILKGKGPAIAAASSGQQSVQVKRANNGVLEMLGFDGKSVSFRAMVETPFSTVSLNSGERSIKASSISNTKGNIVFGGGATAREGSSLMLPGGSTGMKLQKDTEAQCMFDDVPAGFAARSIVFVTDDKSAPMIYELASGIWVKPKHTGESDEPYSAKSGEYDIVELLENNIVEAEISGRNISGINMRIRRLVSYPVSVRIPAGSFFVPQNSSVQNMVATEARKASLASESWQTVQIPVACANRPKDIPGAGDRFSVRRSPAQRELVRLIPALNRPGMAASLKQAAVWIVTDNADYDELGILVDSQGSSRAIGPETAARAMRICADAGISISAKNIWRDRKSIASRLPAGELKNWLESLEASEPEAVTEPGSEPEHADTPDVTETDGESATAPDVPEPADGTAAKVKFEDQIYTVHIGEIARNEKGNITVELLGKGIGSSLPIKDGNMIVPVAMQIVSGGKTVEYESCSIDDSRYLFRFSTSIMPEQVRVYGNDGANSSPAVFDALTKRLAGAGNTEPGNEGSAGLQEGEENLQPDGNCALLHFYRPKSMVGAAISYNVRMEEEQLFRAKNNSRQTVRVTRFGLQTIQAKTESKSEIRIDIEPGMEYYIRCDMKMGAFVGRPSIKLMDRETGKAEYEAVREKTDKK